MLDAKFMILINFLINNYRFEFNKIIKKYITTFQTSFHKSTCLIKSLIKYFSLSLHYGRVKIIADINNFNSHPFIVSTVSNL